MFWTFNISSFCHSTFPFIFIFYVDYVSEFAKTGIERLRKCIRVSSKRMWHLKGWHHLVVEIELDCSLPGFSVQGISQARRLEWIAIFSSRESSPPRDRTHISYVFCFGRRILHHYCHLKPWNRISVSKVWRLENNIGKFKKQNQKKHTFFLSLPSTPNHKYLCVCAGLTRFICVRLCVTLWTIACKALLSVGFSRQNTGVSCHSLLQGIFQTQGSNQGLLHCGRTPPEPLEKPQIFGHT